MDLIVRPLAGFGELNFGTGMPQIIEILGPPDETETLNDGEDEVETLIMHYWNSGITLFIEGPENSVLSNCETENPTSVLFDKQVFELDEPGIIALMNENGFDEFETEMEEWGEKRLSFDDAQIDFYFDEGKLVTINWGVVVNNQGEIL